MSLKTFHLVFITVCVLMALALGVWSLVVFASSGKVADLGFGLGGLLSGGGLAAYERLVLKKLKNFSYL